MNDEIQKRAELKKLLAEDRVEEALTLLTDLLSDDKISRRFKDKLQIIKTRFQFAKESLEKGVITRDNFKKSDNFILLSLLDLIDKIPDEILNQGVKKTQTYLDSTNVEYKKKQVKNYYKNPNKQFIPKEQKRLFKLYSVPIFSLLVLMIFLIFGHHIFKKSNETHEEVHLYIIADKSDVLIDTLNWMPLLRDSLNIGETDKLFLSYSELCNKCSFNQKIYTKDNDPISFIFDEDVNNYLKERQKKNQPILKYPSSSWLSSLFFISLVLLLSVYAFYTNRLSKENNIINKDETAEYIPKISVSKLSEAKLILVGNGEVGKTTIRQNLINSGYGISSHPSTVGIDVLPWTFLPQLFENIKEITLNIWDFGGQGKYRAIQQFFCTRKALYLFVTEPNERNDEDEYVGFDYWMEFISAFGYDKKEDHKSPVIYVMNKHDLNIETSFGQKQFKERFDNVKDAIKISCKTGEGLPALKSAIEKHLLDTKMIGIEFNSNWLTVKEKLYQLDKSFINKSEYYQLCESNKMGKEEADVWLDYLIAVGSVLHFPEKSLTLNDRIILDPNWVREIAYRAIDSSLVKNGRFGIKDAKRIWEGITEPQMGLDLLMSFDLCYDVKENGITQYVIPSLFPKYIEDKKYNIPEFPIENSMIYKVQFEPFIPAGLFQKLIVRQHDFIANKEWCWRNCVIFQRTNTTAKVIEQWNNHQIKINIIGNENGIINMLTTLRNDIARLCMNLQLEKYLEEIHLDEFLIYKGETINIDTYFSIDNPNKEDFNKDDFSIEFESSNLIEEVTKELSKTTSKEGPKIIQVLTRITTILTLTANPKNSAYLRLEEEIRKIKDSLESATHRERFNLLNESSVQVTTITKAMQKHLPEVIHFAGHGAGKDGIEVVGVDGNKVLFPNDGLDLLFKKFKDRVECVVLNACYSKAQAKIISKHGIYVVGMNKKIKEEPAIDFAIGFYQSLGEGSDYEFAFNMGLVAIAPHLKYANTPELWYNGNLLNS